MLVTAIEPRRKGLSALYLDGQQTLVDTETLLSFGVTSWSRMVSTSCCTHRICAGLRSGRSIF